MEDELGMATPGGFLPRPIVADPWTCPRCGISYARRQGEICVRCQEQDLVETEAREGYSSRLAAVDRVTPARFRGLRLEVHAIEEWVLSVVAGRQTEGLLIGGPSGPGKSGNSFAALRFAVERGWMGSVAWESVPDLLAGMELPEQRARVNVLAKAGLVLLDDLGASLETPWVENVLLRLVDARWREQAPTIVTTNLPLTPPPEWPARWSKDQRPPRSILGGRGAPPAFGDRTASRLASFVWVEMRGPDRRRG